MNKGVISGGKWSKIINLREIWVCNVLGMGLELFKVDVIEILILNIK